MSSIYRIKEQMDDYTSTEKKIASYILDNRDLVISNSVQQIAENIGVSPAAVVRFSKKAGFKGFSNLKVSLARDHNTDLSMENTFIIDGSEDLSTLFEKARLSNINTIDISYKLIDMSTFKKVTDKVIKARRVYLAGIGGSGIVANDMHQKLTRIDKNVVYHEDNNLSISGLTHCNEEDVLLCFPYGEQTKEIINLQNIAKEKGATTVAITQIGTNPLSRLTDYVIPIPKEEGDLRLGAISSRNSMFIISDLLYYSVVNSDYEGTVSKLVESRKLHTQKNK